MAMHQITMWLTSLRAAFYAAGIGGIRLVPRGGWIVISAPYGTLCAVALGGPIPSAAALRYAARKATPETRIGG